MVTKLYTSFWMSYFVYLYELPEQQMIIGIC